MGEPFAPWAAAALVLPGVLMAAGQAGTGDALQLHIVNFNFETVQVTWNASQFPAANLTLLYRLTGDPAYSRCAHYILRRGHTAGCLLAARGDLILSLSLWDGAASLFNQTLWTSDFLKPSSPSHLSFQWHQDSVTVTCSNLSYRGLLYEVQLRSTFDTEWQSREEEACHVTVGGLDADKCYFLRARVRTEESSYGPDTYPSDWSEVAHLHRGELRGNVCRRRRRLGTGQHHARGTGRASTTPGGWGQASTTPGGLRGASTTPGGQGGASTTPGARGRASA